MGDLSIELDDIFGEIPLDEPCDPESDIAVIDLDESQGPTSPDDDLDITKAGWLWRVRGKYRKDKCEACGISERMQIHHIDGNYRNADPENLQTLCVWCHRFVHHTAKRCGWKEPGKLLLLSNRTPVEEV